MIAAPSLLRPVAAATRAGALVTLQTSARPGLAALPKALPRTVHPACTTLSLARLPLSPLSPSHASPRFFSAATAYRAAMNATRRVNHNSDAARDASAAARVAASQAAAPAKAADGPPLDWNTFFQLRKTRRRIQMVFSVVGGLAGGLVGGLFLGSGAAEPLLGQVPLDPFVTLGLLTFGFAALGWLVGPSMGNVVFYAWKRPFRAQMTLKETQFFARVKRNRVDPSNSSAGNPVPDFYGEKISSVAGYRQWLKDQRAYNKKRTTFL